MAWSNSPVATLTVNRIGASEKLTFQGVNGQTGTPEEFIGAVNRLISIANFSATKTGMKRTVIQEVEDE